MKAGTEAQDQAHVRETEAGPTPQEDSRLQPLSAALAPRLYTDAGVLEAEQEAIFARTWQLAGHVADLPQAGSYLTTYAGGRPVLVVRGEDGELHAFRNVCRHRGSELLTGTGTCKRAIRCRYHGWTYRFDGTLIGVPEHRTIPNLDKAQLPLLPARAEVLAGLVFVNLDPHATPLRELCAGLEERLAGYRIPELTPASAGGGSRQQANWKVVVDNYLEGYHVPIAHPGLMRLLDYQNYTADVHEHWVWFDAPLRDKPSDNRLERLYQKLASPMPGLSEADRNIWRYVFIYPNTTIDLYPDQVNTWRLEPDGVGTTKDAWGVYRPAGASPVTRLAQWAYNRLNEIVLDEDVDLVEAVQRGLQIDEYRPGPLSAREVAVAWFADRIRADLQAAGVAAAA